MKKYLLFLLLVFAIISCGLKYEAKISIKKFLSENLVKHYSSLSIMKIDTTAYVTDSMLNVMNKTSLAGGDLKKNTRFASKGLRDKLLFVNVRYRQKLNGAYEIKRKTFYLSMDGKNIVGIKDN